MNLLLGLIQAWILTISVQVGGSPAFYFHHYGPFPGQDLCELTGGRHLGVVINDIKQSKLTSPYEFDAMSGCIPLDMFDTPLLIDPMPIEWFVDDCEWCTAEQKKMPIL